MRYRSGSRAPLRALLATLVSVAALGACDGDNGWSGATGVGGGDDSSRPTVEILAPHSQDRVAVGDSVLVQVHVTDDVALDSVTLAGFSLRGSAELGTQVTVVRFAPKSVALRGLGAAVRDTLITRYLLATSDSLPEDPVYIVAAVRDTMGNVRADTIGISLGGPRITISAPLPGALFRAGFSLPVRIQAADSVGRITTVRLRASDAFVADTAIHLDPSLPSLDTVIVLDVPANAEGALQLQASAWSANRDSSVSNPAHVEVVAASRDVAPPTIRFSVAAPSTAEVTDSVAITVVATDSTKVESVGVTVVPTHRKISGTQALPLRSLTSATDSATFRFSLQQLGVGQQSDTSTVRLEVTAFARDTAGNCGAATVAGTPLSEACQPGTPTLAANAGNRTDILLVRGTTVRPEGATDRLADLVSDGTRVFVSNSSRNRVEVLPVAGSAFTGKVAVGSEPWGLAIGTSGDTLLVANSAGTNISVVPLSTLTEIRRLRIPDVRLYGIDFDVKTDSVNQVTRYDYSDRPQYIAQMAGGQILYSTKPTATESDGTVRIYDPSKDLTNEFNRVTEVFDGYATPVIGKGIVVNALAAALSGQSRVYICPRRLRSTQSDPACLTATARVASDSLARLRAKGLTDTRFDLSADIESVGLTDTTFVAVSGDHSTVAFGEGAVNPGRIFLFRQIGSTLVGSKTETEDLVGNVAQRVIGLGLNGDGSLGMARFDQAYFFDETLRLQGHASAGLPTGGAALDPRNAGYPTDDGRRRAYVSGVDSNGRAFIDVVDSHGYSTLKRVFIRDRVIGGLIAVPVTAGDPAAGTLAMRIFAITAKGVVDVGLTAADIE
jgi:YVTN family beta-propeller protein